MATIKLFEFEPTRSARCRWTLLEAGLEAGLDAGQSHKDETALVPSLPLEAERVRERWGNGRCRRCFAPRTHPSLMHISH